MVNHNNARLAEVWLDDWKHFYYNINPGSYRVDLVLSLDFLGLSGVKGRIVRCRFLRRDVLLAANVEFNRFEEVLIERIVVSF